MRHVYLIGSKGIPANYGGFETFAERLTTKRKSPELTYHVACLSDQEGRDEYLGVDCIRLTVPEIGPAKAVLYDRKAFLFALSEIEKNGYRDATILILACRIGIFFSGLMKKARRLGVRVFVNPDGHEWMRSKWNSYIQKYWKYSEGRMVKEADLLVCDSKEMERYIQTEYASVSPQTCYLSYGADLPGDRTGHSGNDGLPEKSASLYADWLASHNLEEGAYALVVGRFVPENNYETMIREYLTSSVSIPLVLICNVEKNKLYENLQQTFSIESNPRICFAGTVYDTALLTEIRKGAAVYLHGHEVGGTNPSLLEALASTDVNLLLDVPFNREVGEEAALYWTKEEGSLAKQLAFAVKLSLPQKKAFGCRAKNRIRDAYTWDQIVDGYEALFLK